MVRILLIALGAFVAYRVLFRRSGPAGGPKLPTDHERQARRGPVDGGEHVTYEIVEHEGGWAYKVGDVYSETFANREEAVAFAERAAARHERAGSDETIEYQDAAGDWHREAEPGSDRPAADVEPQKR